MAETILQYYNDISLNILEFCFGSEYIGETIYPAKTLETLYRFRDFCFNYNIFTSDLVEQQEKARNYVHFDFSVKRPKTLKDL
jgi:hypothetical protein